MMQAPSLVSCCLLLAASLSQVRSATVPLFGRTGFREQQGRELYEAAVDFPRHPGPVARLIPESPKALAAKRELQENYQGSYGRKRKLQEGSYGRKRKLQEGFYGRRRKLQALATRHLMQRNGVQRDMDAPPTGVGADVQTTGDGPITDPSDTSSSDSSGSDTTTAGASGGGGGGGGGGGDLARVLPGKPTGQLIEVTLHDYRPPHAEHEHRHKHAHHKHIAELASAPAEDQPSVDELLAVLEAAGEEQEVVDAFLEEWESALFKAAAESLDTTLDEEASSPAPLPEDPIDRRRRALLQQQQQVTGPQGGVLGRPVFDFDPSADVAAPLTRLGAYNPGPIPAARVAPAKGSYAAGYGPALRRNFRAGSYGGYSGGMAAPRPNYGL